MTDKKGRVFSGARPTGRQHLGKRRKVRVTEIARTGARATVLKKDTN